MDKIRDQKENPINLDIIEDNGNDLGWTPERKSDYLDIKLKEGQNITKIKVVPGSNVASFYLEIVDIEGNRDKIKVFLKL